MQAMMKQQTYESIILRLSGVDYSEGIRFQTIIVNIIDDHYQFSVTLEIW